ncbi:type IV pilus biogenesis/stability protein PilW [Methylomagnum sp.]
MRWWRVPLVMAIAAPLVACSWFSSHDDAVPVRANDPLSELSASQIYIEKGVRYMEDGYYDIALRDLKRAVELDDDNSEAYNALGVLYQKVDDFANAEASFKKAVALKADNYGARNNYGRFLCGRGKYPEAFAQFHQVIGNKLYGTPWIPLTNAGLCAHAAGKKTDAESYLREALDMQPNFPPALLEMARLSQEAGQHMSARAFLERYFSIAGRTPESVQLGIDIENSLGNQTGAEEYARTRRHMRVRSPQPGTSP